MTTDRLSFDHVKVEVAFASTPDDLAPVWTDISAWVDMDAGVSITTGRADEFATVQTGTCSVTLDNVDGRFTVGNAASPYYPNVKIRKKIRISYQNPSGPGPISYRFAGYVEEWPTAWPGGMSTYSTAVVTASDRFKRLGKVNALRSLITQEYLLDNPVADFTLGEPTGSTTAGDTSRNGLGVLTTLQVGTGGDITFGANTGPGTDALPAPAFAPINSTNGAYLTGTGPTANGPTGSMEAFVLTSATTVSDQSVIRLKAADGSVIKMFVNPAGKAAGTNYNPATSAADFTVVSPTSINDGTTHHLALTQSIAAGVATVNLILDGVSVASTTYSYALLATLPAYSEINIGGYSSGECFGGTISHAAIYLSALSVPRLLSHYTAGKTGFAGERSDQRVARLATYAGIPVGEQSLEVGLSTSIAFVDTTGVAPLQAMQDVAATENGVLFMDGSGLLTFQARSHRYNTVSTFTVDVADVDPGLRFITNDALMVNDVTASHAKGITFRAVNKASVDDYGTSALTLTLLATTDNEVIDAANWRANLSANITPRLPNLTLDLLTSPALHAAAMLLPIGSRVTLTGLPAQAPAPTLDLFIEGWTETISSSGWVLVWNTSPADQSAVWRIGIAGFSEIGVTTRVSY